MLQLSKQWRASCLPADAQQAAGPRHIRPRNPNPHGSGLRKTLRKTSKSTETLDGEGGYTVYGKLVPVARSLTEGALPIGLAHGVRLTSDVTAGSIVHMSDVALDQGSVALKLRREMAGETGITSAAQTAQMHDEN